MTVEIVRVSMRGVMVRPRVRVNMGVVIKRVSMVVRVLTVTMNMKVRID